jgi:hypothetical protein
MEWGGRGDFVQLKTNHVLGMYKRDWKLIRKFWQEEEQNEETF